MVVSVVCSGGGHSHCGGILGHGLKSTTTIRDCLFSGTISGTTTATGIIYGWGDIDGTHTIVNCMANGTYTNCNDIDLLKKAGGTEVITNCYKKQNIGSQGTYTTATGSDLQALLGNGWEVRGANVVPKMKSPVSDFENPVFTDVIIDNTTANVSTDYVDFVGTYSPVVYNNEDHSVLFLGGNNTLYYPDGSAPSYINACRAYFQLNGITAGDPSAPNSIRAFKLNFSNDNDVTTGILDAEADSSLFTLHSSLSSYYTLDGVKLDKRPTRKGMYIYNGKKIVITRTE